MTLPYLMETTPEKTTPAPNKCVVCASPDYEEGYVTPMCADCRTKLSRLHVPLWVKLFAGAILCLTLLDAGRMQRFLYAGIHYTRGQNAVAQNRYVTAEREFKDVAGVVPDCIENNARLIISSSYNLDFTTLNETAEKVSGQESEERELIDETNRCLDRTNSYFPDAELDSLLVKIKPYPTAVYIDSLTNYSQRNASDLVAKYLLSSEWFDHHDYHLSDSVLTIVLQNDNSNIEDLSLMGAIKREEKQYATADSCYNTILGLNCEFADAIAGKAKVALKQHNDSAATRFAGQAYAIDPECITSMEAMSLVYYFNKNQQGADKMLNEIKKYHPGDTSMYNYVHSIINGHTIYR